MFSIYSVAGARGIFVRILESPGFRNVFLGRGYNLVLLVLLTRNQPLQFPVWSFRHSFRISASVFTYQLYTRSYTTLIVHLKKLLETIPIVQLVLNSYSLF